MTRSYREWRKIVDDHYGSLDNFTDPTTIRHFLEAALAWRRMDIEMIARHRGAVPLQDLIDTFAEERAENDKAIAELEAWIAKRAS